MARHDHLWHSGHTNRIGTNSAQESQFRPRLLVRAPNHRIDTLVKHNLRRGSSNRMGKSAQLRVVGMSQRRKASTETLIIRPQERIGPRETRHVDMVAYEHKITWTIGG